MPLRLIPHIHRATHRIGLDIAALGEPAVNQGEAHVLAHLLAAGESTVGAVHRAFGHKRSTLTGILDRLEARKLIVRASDARDRRTFLVTLTPAGRGAARRVVRHLEAFEARVLRGASQEDLQAVLRVLGRCDAAGDW